MRRKPFVVSAARREGVRLCHNWISRMVFCTLSVSNGEAENDDGADLTLEVN
jgi:hypothetical protein